jgi:hypothetical protein
LIRKRLVSNVVWITSSLRILTGLVGHTNHNILVIFGGVVESRVKMQWGVNLIGILQKLLTWKKRKFLMHLCRRHVRMKFVSAVRRLGTVRKGATMILTFIQQQVI